jgi:alpha-ketoglutarate-dependent taurine dioxygenase
MSTSISKFSPLVRDAQSREPHKSNWDEIREILNYGRGYVILKDFPVVGRSEADISTDFEALAGRFGTVTPHGASGQTIWRITPRPNLDHVPTFSEAAGEAPFHTDNSWDTEPEQYFALLVVRPADVGGESVLYPVSDLLWDFARTPHGPATIRTLQGLRFPFAMPVVFRSETESAAKVTPVVTSPVILNRSMIRYRYDVLKAGFNARPGLATAERVDAVEKFNEFVTGVRRTAPTVRLETGDLLIANNYTVLHARTDFADPKRLLLRARMSLPVTRH